MPWPIWVSLLSVCCGQLLLVEGLRRRWLLAGGLGIALINGGTAGLWTGYAIAVGLWSST